jgi:hypothetical protein
VYSVILVPLDDPNVIAGVQAYAAKYQLSARTGEAPPDALLASSRGQTPQLGFTTLTV